MRRPFRVLATYAVLLLAGIALALPNLLPAATRAQLPGFLAANTVSLGLDLQGGAHLLLAVDRAALSDHTLREATDTARALAEAEGADPRQVRRSGAEVTLPASEALEVALRTRATEGLAPTEAPRFTVARDGERLRLTVPEAVLDRIAAATTHLLHIPP